MKITLTSICMYMLAWLLSQFLLACYEEFYLSQKYYLCFSLCCLWKTPMLTVHNIYSIVGELLILFVFVFAFVSCVCSYLVGFLTFFERIILNLLEIGVELLWDLHRFFVRELRKLFLWISWIFVRRML